MKTSHVLSAAVLAAACAGGALAATSATDREFATQVARDNAEEIGLGRLATEHGHSEAVKAFGRRLVADHTQAGEELKSAARQDGIDLPNNDDSKSDDSRLASLQGSEFDRAFAHKMVADHEKDIARFRKEAQASGDSNVKTFAQKTLPTLEEHLRMARELPAHENADGARRDR